MPVNYMEFKDILKARRSVRKFRDEEVSNEKIRKILEMANFSPSAGNLQARKVIIVRDKEAKKKVSEAALGQESIVRAPVCLVICAVPGESARKYGERGRDLYSVQDATIFAAYIQLAAVEAGLATVWIGAFDEDMLKDVLDSDDDIKPIAIIPLGYPAEEPEGRGRKSLKEIIHKEL